MPNRPYWLCMPAFGLYGVLLAVPLLMTIALSLDGYDRSAGIVPDVTLANYLDVLRDPYFHAIFLRTLAIALTTTLVCAAVGAPEAWILSRLPPGWRAVSLPIVVGPLLISVVVRTLGWTILIGRSGLINQSLLGLHLVDRPVAMLFTEPAIVVALVHVLLPFMVLAVSVSLRGMDRSTERAARSLGASTAVVFGRVVLPQIVPGILAGSLIVFSLAASAFATPALIGGRRLKVAATVIYDEFLTTLNWPLGAAIACLLVVSVMALGQLWERMVERRFAVDGR